jgi:hypothetical protein
MEGRHGAPFFHSMICLPALKTTRIPIVEYAPRAGVV